MGDARAASADDAIVEHQATAQAHCRLQKQGVARCTMESWNLTYTAVLCYVATAKA
jgi:hypothetical protein